MFDFRTWRPFRAFRDTKVTRAFLDRTGKESVQLFKEQMLAPKSGRIYHKKGGRVHRASAPYVEFPANDEGALRKSARYDVSGDQMEVGTDMFYSKFLREGTGKMARRKMSDDALRETLPKTRKLLRGWVGWKR